MTTNLTLKAISDAVQGTDEYTATMRLLATRALRRQAGYIPDVILEESVPKLQTLPPLAFPIAVAGRRLMNVYCGNDTHDWGTTTNTNMGYAFSAYLISYAIPFSEPVIIQHCVSLLLQLALGFTPDMSRFHRYLDEYTNEAMRYVYEEHTTAPYTRMVQGKYQADEYDVALAQARRNTHASRSQEIYTFQALNTFISTIYDPRYDHDIEKLIYAAVTFATHLFVKAGMYFVGKVPNVNIHGSKVLIRNSTSHSDAAQYIQRQACMLSECSDSDVLTYINERLMSAFPDTSTYLKDTLYNDNQG